MFIEQFLNWAHNNLLENEEAQSYLLGRGISREQWALHLLGFVSDDFDVDSSSYPGHSDSCLDFDKKNSWCDACRYKRWSSTWEDSENNKKIQIIGRKIHGCVVFPLTSYSGIHIGFQVRSIHKKEYDTFAVQRRPEGYFFGSRMNFQEIWSTKKVILVEGPGDHLIIERLVAPYVLALTTSGLSRLQMQFVRRFVRHVYLCLDLDKAGRDGVRNFIKQHGSEFDVIDVKYKLEGAGKDACDIWKKIGDDKFRSHMARALNV